MYLGMFDVAKHQEPDPTRKTLPPALHPDHPSSTPPAPARNTASPTNTAPHNPRRAALRCRYGHPGRSYGGGGGGVGDDGGGGRRRHRVVVSRGVWC